GDPNEYLTPDLRPYNGPAHCYSWVRGRSTVQIDEGRAVNEKDGNGVTAEMVWKALFWFGNRGRGQPYTAGPLAPTWPTDCLACALFYRHEHCIRRPATTAT
ncbi:unnamed protein product, partial [Pylaiella littoralis]